MWKSICSWSRRRVRRPPSVPKRLKGLTPPQKQAVGTSFSKLLRPTFWWSCLQVTNISPWSHPHTFPLMYTHLVFCINVKKDFRLSQYAPYGDTTAFEERAQAKTQPVWSPEQKYGKLRWRNWGSLWGTLPRWPHCLSSLLPDLGPSFPLQIFQSYFNYLFGHQILL